MTLLRFRFENESTAGNRRVLDVAYDRPLDSRYRPPETFGTVDHEETARELATQARGFASVIVTCQDLRKDLWEDSAFMHICNEVALSKVRRDARRRLTNRYFTDRQCEALLERLALPRWKKNHGDDIEESSRKFKIELHDEIWRAQEQMAVFDIMEELKEKCRWDYDEAKDEERKRPEEEYEAEWKRVKLEANMPEVTTNYERVYAMPEPFRYWDARNRFQQWYFIQHDSTIAYHQGGSGSSQQREKQGRYGHVFAVLSKHHGIRIPTYVLMYDETNRLLLMCEYESFKAVDQELVGNYRADWSEKDRLFEGMLLTVDHSSAMTREKT